MIYCLYKDFFNFLKLMNTEENRWKSFEHQYYGKHREFLSHIWFNFQGYTERNIRERVELIKPGDYSGLESGLIYYDIESTTRLTISRCEKFLSHAGICDVYLFIGFFSPDAFVAPYRDTHVICVGLERFQGFTHYPLLIAHEFCHYVLNEIYGPGSRGIASRLVREGICVYFSKLVFPGKKENQYLFMKEKKYHDLVREYPNILEKLLKEEDNIGDIFHARYDALPSRAGYFIGYTIVNDYIKRTGNSDIAYLLDHQDSIFMDLHLW
jgi:hypothetical protein